MPEEIKEGAVIEQPTPKSEPAKKEEISAETLTEKIKADLELKYKDEISGRDKKLTQIQKELNARLTEEERLKIESENRIRATLEKYSKIAVKAAGLDESFASLISGSNEDEIDLKIDAFTKIKESITKEYEKKIKALEDELNIYKANGPVPKKGAGGDSKAMAEADYLKLSATAQRDFILGGGTIQ